MVDILSGATAARSIAQPTPQSTSEASISEQASAAESVPSKFFLSPVIRFDSEALAVIFEIRDRNSGEVTKQFPPERVVRELQKTADLTPETTETPTASNSNSADAVTTVQTSESGSSGGSEQEVDVLI